MDTIQKSHYNSFGGGPINKTVLPTGTGIRLESMDTIQKSHYNSII